jgi:predicted SAM-dependent methyltransferase
VGTALFLPFATATFEYVYFGHTLEHLTYADAAPAALHEAHRVLTPGGLLGIVGPAMDLAIATDQPQWLLDDIAQHIGDNDGLGHQWTATVDNTLALVRSVFEHSQVVDVREVGRSTGWPNTVADPWQVAILARKP